MTDAAAQDPRRRQHLRRAVAAGLDRWRRSRPAPPPASVSTTGTVRVLRPDLTFATVALPPGPGVLAPLPRRRPFETGDAEVTPASRTREVFRASSLAALRRLFVWLYAAAWYAAGALADRLRRRHTREQPPGHHLGLDVQPGDVGEGVRVTALDRPQQLPQPDAGDELGDQHLVIGELEQHADPHPANVVVRPGGEIVLIDFGSCGAYNENQLHAVRQFHYCQANEDISGMVQCVLALLEPLPPIDIDALTKEVEGVFTDSIHALKSGHCEWWERTSAGVWIGFMRMARKYHIQIDLDTLRMIRSTLLYDTLAARLWADLDVYREYQEYRKLMAAAARKRFRKRLRRLWKKGIDDRAFLRLEELVDLGNRVAYHLQRTLDSPSYRFTFLAGKAVFAISSAIHWLVLSLTAGAVGAVGLGLWRAAAGEPLDVAAIVTAVAGSPWYLGTVGLLLVVNVRRVLFRFGDRDG